MNIEQLYRIRCEQPSSIHLHLPTLRSYAVGCKKVTEFGVQGGISTTAFLAAHPLVVHSYDLEFDLCLLNLTSAGILQSAWSTDFTMTFDDTIWKYYFKSSLHAEISQTDLLFIDTRHTYLQLREELSLHHAKVNKWIIMHDTESFGEFSENRAEFANPSKEQIQGLKYAIAEFLSAHPEWKTKEHIPINNGLTVLERR